MSKNKTIFKVGEVEYAVVRPGPRDVEAGQKVYNKAFKVAIESEAIIREQVPDILKKRALWDDEKQAEADKLNAEVIEAEKVLGRGYRLDDKNQKVTLKLSEAKKVALGLWELRQKLRVLARPRNAIDGETAQAQADNARFNFYVASCLVYNQGEKEGQKVFKDVEDYLEHGSEKHAFTAAGHLASLLVGGSDPDWEKKLPENAFLLKYKFVDEKLRLINKDGHLVDSEGRPVNEDGHYVNDKGELVNKDGDRVDTDGNYVFEDRRDFIDDLGLAASVEGPKEASGPSWTDDLD